MMANAGMLKKNELVELEITDIDARGFGVGYADGFTLFVDGAIPGERVRVKIITLKPRYGYGKLEEVLTESPHRTAPKCSIFEKCGGCQWQHIAYEQQLIYKKKIITEALRRIGGISDPIVEDVIGMADPWHYRNKGIFPVVPIEGAEDSTRANFAIGMYAPRSHRIVPVTRCLIQNPAHAAMLEALQTYMTAHKIPAYNETTHTGLVRYVMTRTAVNTGETMAVIVINSPNPLPHEDNLIKTMQTAGAKNLIICHNKTPGNTIFNAKDFFRVLYGAGYITEKIGEINYRLSAMSFFQVNTTQTEILYNIAADFAAAIPRQSLIIDAHAGVGGTALIAAHRNLAETIIGIDIIKPAVTDATTNATLNNLTNTEFICGAAEEIIPALLTQGDNNIPDTIFLDPPRKGCDPALLQAIITADVSKIVYISCEPSTLARDVKILQGFYSVKSVKTVDMFPMTGKVEIVALLELKR